MEKTYLKPQIIEEHDIERKMVFAASQTPTFDENEGWNPGCGTVG